MLEQIINLLQSTGRYGVILIVTGLLIRFIVASHRFSRRGVGGLQHFSSYAVALIVTAIEGAAAIVGIFLIIKGVLVWVT
jgi:hypothetical protein